MIWFKTNRSRFIAEKVLLARFHPGAKMVIKNSRMSVFKQIVTSKDIYLIEAQYSDKHPYRPMNVFIREPRLKKSPPHQYIKGQLCLHDLRDVGPETTAKIYLDWAKQWIGIYERWLEGEPWPDTNQG